MILPIRLSDSRRTVVAYFALFVSMLGVVFTSATTTYSYLHHVLIEDISKLVRGYYASDALLTISVVGTATGTTFAIGCHICFQLASSQDRKARLGWIIAYMVLLIVDVVAFGYAAYECYTGLQKPIEERSLEACPLFSGHWFHFL